MSHEVLQQALEALEKASKQIIYANVRPERDILISIAAIREALAQPEQDIDYWIKQHTEARQAELELRRELEASQPEQAPPQREWVGLTDDEKESLGRCYITTGQSAHNFIVAIEVALKVKNT